MSRKLAGKSLEELTKIVEGSDVHALLESELLLAGYRNFGQSSKPFPTEGKHNPVLFQRVVVSPNGKVFFNIQRWDMGAAMREYGRDSGDTTFTYEMEMRFERKEDWAILNFYSLKPIELLRNLEKYQDLLMKTFEAWEGIPQQD